MNYKELQIKMFDVKFEEEGEKIEIKMFVVKFEEGKEIKITEKQKELLCILSSVIDNFLEDDVLLMPRYISREIFIQILRFIDLYPSDFDYNFAKPIDKTDFHNKAYIFENWIQSMDKKLLFNLLNGANYLIINSLISLLSAYIALRIKYMTNEEMKDYFTC